MLPQSRGSYSALQLWVVSEENEEQPLTELSEPRFNSCSPQCHVRFCWGFGFSGLGNGVQRDREMRIRLQDGGSALKVSDSVGGMQSACAIRFEKTPRRTSEAIRWSKVAL